MQVRPCTEVRHDEQDSAAVRSFVLSDSSREASHLQRKFAPQVFVAMESIEARHGSEKAHLPHLADRVHKG